MQKLLAPFALCLFLSVVPVLAHHPAEDIVDEEIYEMIDEMVSDTPHADLVFDEDMGTTIITTDSVSAAEDLIDDGLLSTLSLLEDDVSVTISFGEDIDVLESANAEEPDTNRWTERNDWGRSVIFTVDTLLFNED